jgi:hypothetical protein
VTRNLQDFEGIANLLTSDPFEQPDAAGVDA